MLSACRVPTIDEIGTKVPIDLVPPMFVSGQDVKNGGSVFSPLNDLSVMILRPQSQIVVLGPTEDIGSIIGQVRSDLTRTLNLYIATSTDERFSTSEVYTNSTLAIQRIIIPPGGPLPPPVEWGETSNIQTQIFHSIPISTNALVTYVRILAEQNNDLYYSYCIKYTRNSGWEISYSAPVSEVFWTASVRTLEVESAKPDVISVLNNSALWRHLVIQGATPRNLVGNASHPLPGNYIIAPHSIATLDVPRESGAVKVDADLFDLFTTDVNVTDLMTSCCFGFHLPSNLLEANKTGIDILQDQALSGGLVGRLGSLGSAFYIFQGKMKDDHLSDQDKLIALTEFVQNVVQSAGDPTILSFYQQLGKLGGVSIDAAGMNAAINKLTFGLRALNIMEYAFDERRTPWKESVIFTRRIDSE